jgi:hypothetical protein
MPDKNGTSGLVHGQTSSECPERQPQSTTTTTTKTDEFAARRIAWRWVLATAVAVVGVGVRHLWVCVDDTIGLSVQSVPSTHPPLRCAHVAGPMGAEDIVVSGAHTHTLHAQLAHFACVGQVCSAAVSARGWHTFVVQCWWHDVECTTTTTIATTTAPTITTTIIITITTTTRHHHCDHHCVLPC